MIDLISKKRCGNIKGSTVTNGQKQCDLYTSAKVSSLALLLEGFINSLLSDTAEHWHIAIADVEGDFLKADMKDHVIF